MQRWAGRPIWLRSAEASVERWSPPFCGIRTSVVCWLSNQSVGSPVPRRKKRAGYGVLGCSLLQPLWDRHWGGPGRWCFWPPVCVCVCVFVCVCRPNLSKHAQTARSNNYVLPLCDRTMSSACEFCVCVCVCECTGGLKRRARGGAEDSARSASVNGHGIEGSQGHSYPLSSAHSGVFCAHCWRS